MDSIIIRSTSIDIRSTSIDIWLTLIDIRSNSIDLRLTFDQLQMVWNETIWRVEIRAAHTRQLATLVPPASYGFEWVKIKQFEVIKSKVCTLSMKKAIEY